jgi:hypothetical protein
MHITVSRSRLRRYPRRTVVILAVLGAAVAMMFAAGRSATAEAGLAQPPAYDAETTLWGTLFGVGPFVDRYPKLVLHRLTEATTENLMLVADSIATADQRTGFLSRFGLAMYSGDRVAIRNAACEANSLLRDALALTSATGSGWCYDPGGDGPRANGKPQGDAAFAGWIELVARTLGPTM